MTSEKTKVLYIGITCGLSAPYVAGQLEFCMDHSDKFIPVLIGFNPVDAARLLFRYKFIKNDWPNLLMKSKSAR